MTLNFFFSWKLLCVLWSVNLLNSCQGHFPFCIYFFYYFITFCTVYFDGWSRENSSSQFSVNFSKKKKKIFSRLQILQPPRKTACFPYLLLRPQNTTWWLRHDEIKPELKYWWSKFPSPCSSFLVYRPHITRISASFGMSLSITSIITPFPPRLSCLSGYANKYKFQFASPSR